MRSIVIVALAITLGGCAQWRAQQIARQNAADDAQCRSYGAVAPSPAYYDCRMRLNELAVQRAAIAQQAFANMTATGLAIAAASQPAQPAPQPPQQDHVCVGAGELLYRC